MGVQEFIEKDFSGSFADVGRLPGLLPLLTRVNPAELLGQHYGRSALPPATTHDMHSTLVTDASAPFQGYPPRGEPC